MPKAGKVHGDLAKGGEESKPIWTVGASMRPRAIAKPGGQVILLGMPSPAASSPGTGLVRSYSAATGKLTTTIELPSSPVWDGVAVASGRIFVTTENGSIVCLGR